MSQEAGSWKLSSTKQNLGAPQQTVRWMFVRQGLLLTVIGVAFGLAAALALTHLMTALLFDVSPIDPVTYAGVSVILIAAARAEQVFGPGPPSLNLPFPQDGLK